MIIKNFLHNSRQEVTAQACLDCYDRKGRSTVDKAILAVVFDKEKEESADMLSQAAVKLAGGGQGNRQSYADRARRENLKVFEVLYNPVSLRISTEGGRAQFENVQNPGNSEPNLQSVQPEDTNLTFELLIDGEDTRKTINALMGMLSSERNRQVIFAWGGMSFPGEVVSLSSSYHMFDLAGKPIRGKVNMTVRQNGSRKEQQQYWEKAFENF